MTHASVVQLQMLAPAVTGTTNVLRAASAAGVQRVVVVSSIVAVEINPKDWPQGKIRDESCWSDEEFCRNNNVTCFASGSLTLTHRQISDPTFTNSLLDLAAVCV